MTPLLIIDSGRALEARCVPPYLSISRFRPCGRAESAHEAGNKASSGPLSSLEIRNKIRRHFHRHKENSGLISRKPLNGRVNRDTRLSAIIPKCKIIKPCMYLEILRPQASSAAPLRFARLCMRAWRSHVVSITHEAAFSASRMSGEPIMLRCERELFSRRKSAGCILGKIINVENAVVFELA